MADHGRTGKRVTAEDYEAFITSLCAMPPGPERDQCVKHLIADLLRLYSNLRLAPPPGLSAFANRIGGHTVNTEEEVAFLLAAVRQAVSRTSIRAVANASRLSHGAVFNLVNGLTRKPTGTTIGKLRDWYVQHYASSGEGLPPEGAKYLMEQLLASIPSDGRIKGALELVQALERIYDRHRTPRPTWLPVVRNEYRRGL